MNAQTLSNDTILIEIATDTNLTCEQIQEVYGQPLSIEVNVENVLRYVQALYYIINLCFGVFVNLFVIVHLLFALRISYSSLDSRYVLVICSMVQYFFLCLQRMPLLIILYSLASALCLDLLSSFLVLLDPISCLCWFLIAFLLSLYHFGTNDSGSEWSFLSLLVLGS